MWLLHKSSSRHGRFQPSHSRQEKTKTSKGSWATRKENETGQDELQEDKTKTDRQDNQIAAGGTGARKAGRFVRYLRVGTAGDDNRHTQRVSRAWLWAAPLTETRGLGQPSPPSKPPNPLDKPASEAQKTTDKNTDDKTTRHDNEVGPNCLKLKQDGRR